MNSNIIIPVKHTYQVGLNVVGGCRLDNRYTDCFFQLNNSNNDEFNEFCYHGFFKEPRIHAKTHNFDEIVISSDYYNVDMSVGVVYRYNYYDEWLVHASIGALSNTSDYCSKYFSGVMTDLISRRVNISNVVKECPAISSQRSSYYWPLLYTTDEVFYFTTQMYHNDDNFSFIADNRVYPLSTNISHNDWMSLDIETFAVTFDDNTRVNLDEVDPNDLTQQLLDGEIRFTTRLSNNSNINNNDDDLR